MIAVRWEYIQYSIVNKRAKKKMLLCAPDGTLSEGRGLSLLSREKDAPCGVSRLTLIPPESAIFRSKQRWVLCIWLFNNQAKLRKSSFSCEGVETNMKSKLLLPVVLFFILESAAVSSIDSLSHTFKSNFYILAMVVLGIIVLLYLFGKVKSVKE